MPQAPAQPPYQAPPPYQNAPAPQYRQMPGQAPVAAARKSAIALLVFSILSVLFWGLLFFLNPSDTDIMNLCLIIWGFFYGVFALIQSAKCKKLLPLVLSSSEISFSLLIFVATVYFGEWVDNFFLLVFFLFSAAFVLVILIWSIRQITRRPIWQ
jgi:peptidoglycan/LPS O-acetylase OafA/YrhL